MNGANGNDPAAVVGIGCRLPGGVDSLDSLWQLLEAGRPAIGRMPRGRFDIDRFLDPEPLKAGRVVTAEGGFLEHIDQFDAAFFGISPREAIKVDPQHRLLLELSWEALENAAIVPSSLAGSRTGVYLGLWSNEYETVMSRQIPDVDLYTTTGGGRYAASGRISFALDLRGPSLTLDTGCSSSLVALHLACQALRAGEAEVALAGAANLILQPYISVGYSRSGMLSPGARCRFGAPSPDGYVRSEGAVVVALKPLSAALRDGNPVHAVVLGSCVNADGGGSGLLVAPSADGQAAMLRDAWARAGVPRESVAYVEAHGTGTAAGDGVELRALASVLGRRNGDGPLPVGSIKTLIGHTEAAAGLAGLLKAILVLRHRRVPADAVGIERNPEIAWDALGVDVVRTPVVLGAPRAPLVVAANSFGVTGTNARAPLIVAVNSFGVTGTNAHVVLRDAPETRREFAEGAEGAENGFSAVPRVVAVSARTRTALADAVRRLREFVDSDSVSLRDLSYTTTCRREHHSHRLALVGESRDEIRAALDEYLAGENSARVFAGESREPRVGFVFSGQGSQWVGMGRELLECAPVFAAAIDACERALGGLVDWSLRAVLAGDVRLDRVDVIQPTLTALQIALARLLESWGVRPAAVVGHSMGEVAAAHVAGALTLADAMRVVALRSRLLARIAGQGAMALVDLPEKEVAARLEAAATGTAGVGAAAERVSIAAVNGPRSTVVSGDPAGIDALLREFESEDVFCRRVNVDVASHSAQTDPLLPELRDGLRGIAPIIPEIPFHSTVRPGDAGLLDAGYWAENLRRPVRLADAVQGMSVDVLLEISPHPVLVTALADITAGSGRGRGRDGDGAGSVACLGLLQREEPEYRRLLEAVARLHVAGVRVDWGAFAEPGARAIALPAYPWQRESFWLENWDDWSESASHDVDVWRPEALDSLLYRVEWRAVDAAPGRLRGTWVLLESGERELDDAVAAAIDAAGGVVVRAGGSGGEQGAAGAVGAANAVAADAAVADPVAGIIDVRAVVAVCDGGGESFEAAVRDVCRGALDLVQALDRRGARPEFGVWWVTRGAQGTTHRTPADSTVAQAALWGLVRTLWQNHSELQPHLVDLEPGSGAAELAAQIVAAVAWLRDEAQVAWEQGRAQVARLVRMGDAPRRPARWRADVSYLLAGGLGEVGLTVAEEMVRGGARRLVLLGRSGLPAREHWGDAGLDERTANRIAGVLRLERLGASVHVHAVDVADEAALANMLAQFRAEQWPEIHGVVHLAAAVDNQIVHDFSTDSFIAAMRGKATGAWNLHRLLPRAEHVYFSSIVSVLPQSGRATYAAANAVLDALAYARRGAGLPAISLAWGVWHDTGLARDAQVTTFVEFMHQNGIESFARDVGANLFRWVAQFDAPHVVVGAVDWGRAAARLKRRPGASFYRELIGEQGTRAGFVAELAALTQETRREVVRERVRAIAAGVLRMPADALPLHQPLGRRGLDSLMAMELRNRLEIQFEQHLAVSVVWNYPTIEALASYLIARVEEQLDATRAEETAVASTSAVGTVPRELPREISAIRTHGLDAFLAQIADTTDDEVLRMLQEER